jgi:hypothetical protein
MSNRFLLPGFIRRSRRIGHALTRPFLQDRDRTYLTRTVVQYGGGRTRPYRTYEVPSRVQHVHDVLQPPGSSKFCNFWIWACLRKPKFRPPSHIGWFAYVLTGWGTLPYSIVSLDAVEFRVFPCSSFFSSCCPHFYFVLQDLFSLPSSPCRAASAPLTPSSPLAPLLIDRQDNTVVFNLADWLLLA